MIQKVDYQSTTPFCVFVDIPNIQHCGEDKNPAASDKDWHINVESLGYEARNIFPNAEMLFGGAYAILQAAEEYRRNEWFTHASAAYARQDFTLNCLVHKDIDVLIVNDIWRCVMDQQEALIRETGYRPDRITVRHVLFSGDGGYLRVYDAIREVLGDALDLELVVYSRKYKLNKDLARVASDIRIIDEIPGFYW